MGLDWNPLARPKPGYEAEFEQIFREIKKQSDVKSSAELRKRFCEISQPPFEVLGAPRVGIDASANEWLRQQLGKEGRPKGKEFDEVCKRMHGYYVLDLLPECDGFPVYSNYGAYEGLDRYSFRAKFLEDTLDVLGDKLCERAFDLMLAKDLERYGTEIYDKAGAYARSEDVMQVEHIRDWHYREGAPATKAHILFSAAKWCLYWARRGHGLEPYY